MPSGTTTNILFQCCMATLVGLDEQSLFNIPFNIRNLSRTTTGTDMQQPSRLMKLPQMFDPAFKTAVHRLYPLI